MKIILIVFIPLLIFSCTPNDSVLTFNVKETAGIDRELEFVEIQWSLRTKPGQDDTFSIAGQDGKFEGQILDVIKGSDGQFTVTAIFPVTIKANKSKDYKVVMAPSQLKTSLNVKGDGLALEIENDYFIADLTANKFKADAPLSSGQVRSLILKNYDNQVLKRSHINMHWSPNFQGKGREYAGLSHMIDPDVGYSEIGAYKTSIYKEGKIDGYPEIKLKAKYEFYAGMPYFVFSSEIYIERDIELYLLRNDEMTLDSLFTNLIFSDESKRIKNMPLYEESTYDYLQKDPIKDDAPWLAFYNRDLNYGYGSIRLKYGNKNPKDIQSPLYLPHSKISPVEDGGRYWNRRLIHEKNTFVPKGSKYYEKNAYCIFDTGSSPIEQIVNLHQRLHNPLQVSYF